VHSESDLLKSDPKAIDVIKRFEESKRRSSQQHEQKNPARNIDLLNILLFFCWFFVVSGSLYPFQLRDTALSATHLFTASRFGVSDIAANIVLFLPVGFLCRVQSGGKKRSFGFTLGLSAISLFLGIFVQLLQLVFDQRDPSLMDFLWNCLGFALGLAIGQAIILQPGKSAIDARPITVILIYLFLIYQLVPFAPTLDTGLIKTNIKRAFAVPFSWQQFITQLSMWYVFCILVYRHINIERRLTLLLFSGAALLSAKFLIEDNSMSVATISAAMVGLCLFYVTKNSRSTGFLVILMASFAWLLDGLTPFIARPRMIMPNVIPLVDLVQSGNWLGNIISLIWKSYFLGVILFFSIVRNRFKLGVLFAALLVLIVEAGQIFLESGWPSVTDFVILAAMAILVRGLFQTNRINTPDLA
jgi:hypothetical protein